jgi:predicted TIM-barrel fold metal-dependent hydrolase
MGGRNVIDAIIAANNAPNIFLETSGIYPMMLDRAIRAVGADRLIFGTDFPYNIPEIEIERIGLMGLSEVDRTKICEGNLSQILAPIDAR